MGSATEMECLSLKICMTSGGNTCNDFPGNQLTKNITVMEQHREVVE